MLIEVIRMIDNKHEQFKNKIKSNIYNILEMMYEVIKSSSYDMKCIEKSNKLADILQLGDRQIVDKKFKISIYYLRWCKIIHYVLEYYKNNNEKSEILTDYYINSNILKEMNCLGIGYYFDIKYQKDNTNLYSTSYGRGTNWIDWIQGQNIDKNQLKENGVQLIFKACKTHINRGGNIKLISLSKCFGIDLFKYMHFDENGNVNLYIIKNAPVNFIQIRGEKKSIQEYLISDEFFDIRNKPQFCIDFTNVRNNKLENYNNWSKKFLGDKQYISQKEFDYVKTHIPNEYKEFDDLILDMIEKKHKNGTNKAISSRVSPIKDREVVVSDNLWNTYEYNQNSFKTMLNENCYHVVFNKEEYLQLIYYYFKRYAEKKVSNTQYDKVYNDTLESLKKQILEKIEKLNFDNSKVEKNEKESVLKFYLYYVQFIDSVKKYISENIPEKINFVLENIDWKTEHISKEWSLKNIYNYKFNKIDNFWANYYKCLCKDTAINIERG